MRDDREEFSTGPECLSRPDAEHGEQWDAVPLVPWGKAELLVWLAPRLQHGSVPPLLSLSVDCWRTGRENFLAKCRKLVSESQLLAVRSASYLEDAAASSHAGRFESVLHVSQQELAAAIERVVAAMPGHPRDGFFVQRMVQPVTLAGVASTHRVADGAPWYCVETAELDSAAVTAGRASGRQVAIARAAALPGSQAWRALPLAVQTALTVLREAEDLLGDVPIEMEFALTADAAQGVRAHVLQIRRITTINAWRRGAGVSLLPTLACLGEPDALAGVAGRRTLLSVMSDWNPAELLGVHPRPLSRSLFADVIGNGVWWNARAQLGYTPSPDPAVALTQLVAGRPMVDLRRSATSLLPAGTPGLVADCLVNTWIDRLEANPELHDKVEFSVFRTARDFASADAVREASHCLAAKDREAWENRLVSLTQRAMDFSSKNAAVFQLAVLDDLAGEDVAHGSWRHLLDRCREGTFAFSMLARVAFIGEAQLRTAVDRGGLLRERAHALRASARATAFDVPHARELQQAMAFQGHLRPSTFDITQSTWDESGIPALGERLLEQRFALTGNERASIDRLLSEARLRVHAAQWVHFVQFGASLRETAKLVFSRHLRAAMVQIERVAGVAGVDRDAVSWLTLEQLRRGSGLDRHERERYWMKCREVAIALYRDESVILMSPMLCKPVDRFVADSFGSLPNFVGHRRAAGPLRILGPRSVPDDSLRGAVVALSCADPGYDWIFEHGIAGLITAWGGANSHLAIRCAESGLAAAIGCGEVVFAKVLHARHACIDPVSGGVWLT